MLIHIIARGKIGRSPESELLDRYVKRVVWPVRVTELPDVGGKMPPMPDGGCKIIALDETGVLLASTSFAQTLAQYRDNGAREIRFLIGAADGLSDAERASADLLLSFGRATWPHMLARAMLAEQIWRAASILANHPYHREG